MWNKSFVLFYLFQAGSLAILCTILHFYILVYIGFGFLCTLVMLKSLSEDYDDAFGYSVTNLLVLCRGFYCKERKSEYKALLPLTVFWWIYHSISLLVFLTWYTVNPDNLSDVSSSRLANPTLFYCLVILLLVLGPCTLLTLFLLKCILKKMDYWVDDDVVESTRLWFSCFHRFVHFDS